MDADGDTVVVAADGWHANTDAAADCDGANDAAMLPMRVDDDWTQRTK